MKLGISNWSIGWRIALALALPMLALLSMALFLGVSQYDKARDQARARTEVEFATVVNTLVHALQLERGTASATMSANSPELDQALNARQLQTDAARQVFGEGLAQLLAQPLASELSLHLEDAGQAVLGLEEIRQLHHAPGDSVSMLMARYAGIVERLIRVTQELLQSGHFQTDVSDTLRTYTRVMQAKEYAGLERGLGVAAFADPNFEPAGRVRLLALGERQSLYLEAGKLFPDAVPLSGSEAQWTAQQAQALAQMRHAAQLRLGGDSMGRISAQRWFDLTTQRIDLMRHAEQRLTQELLQQAVQAEASALQTAAWVAALAILVSSLALWLAWRLGQDIIHPLRRITSTMTHLAHRDQVLELTESQRDDEIGEMARAIKVFRVNLAEVLWAQAQLGSATVLRKKESYQRALLNNFPFEVWLKDIDGVYLAANQAVASQLGLSSPEALVGKTDEQLRSHAQAQRIRADDLEVMQVREPRVQEHQLPAAEFDRARWMETWKAPVIDEHGDLLGTVGFSRDITQEKLAQHEIRQLALFDALTGIPNRRLLHDRLGLAMAHARREHKMLALIFIDLDRFKPVNDTLGHAVGDLLLSAVARRIQLCVRQEDTVARVGGDEFVVLLAVVAHERDALAVAEKIRAHLNEPFELAGVHTVSISSSSGVAMFPAHGQDEPQLSRSADTAMYRAKHDGRNRVVLFDSAMSSVNP